MIPHTEKKKETCCCCCLNSKTKKKEKNFEKWIETRFKKKKKIPEDTISSSLALSLFLQSVISPFRQQKNLEMFPLSSKSSFSSGLFC